MNKIVDGIFVGLAEEVNIAKNNGFSILGVCKDPLHRLHARMRGAEKEGYITKSMPKDEPEYLFADRGHELYCNLIDAPDVKYIPIKVVNRALMFIHDERMIGNRVLIACNRAESRSPSIALMYLIQIGTWNFENNFQDVVENFREIYYPFYKPSAGMLEYTKRFWEGYQNDAKNKKDL